MDEKQVMPVSKILSALKRAAEDNGVDNSFLNAFNGDEERILKFISDVARISSDLKEPPSEPERKSKVSSDPKLFADGEDNLLGKLLLDTQSNLYVLW